MWSPFADRPPRSVAPSSTSGSHQSDRFGGVWMPTSGISPRHPRTSSRIWARVPSGAHGGSLAGIAAVRDEVLEDHLLEVPVLGVHRRQGLERLDAVRLGLPDAHED